MPIVLVVVAIAVSVLAAFIYGKGILKEKSHPSWITWLLLALIAILNATSYQVLSDGGIVALLPKVNSTNTVLTFLFIMYGYRRLRKTLEFPDRIDIVILVAVILVILIVAVWKDFEIAAGANVTIQICAVVAFVPTLRKLHNENPLPWFLWSIGFFLNSIIFLLDWQGTIFALVYPVGGIISNFVIGVLAMRKCKARGIK